jgi:hypothetical protein
LNAERVLELQHLGFFTSQIQVVLVPTFEVRTIVGRKKWMRLAIALDLRGFVQRLPAYAALGVRAVDPLAAERFDDREHAAIAEIAVVRDGEDLRAGLLLAHHHPFPQVARIGAAQRRLRRVRFDQACFCAAVAEDDVPVQVVALVVRGPLVPMNAVNRPGSYASSAALIVSCHALR